jgi:hypothetical protein
MLVIGGEVEWLFRIEGGEGGFGRWESARDGLNASDQ